MRASYFGNNCILFLYKRLYKGAPPPPRGREAKVNSIHCFLCRFLSCIANAQGVRVLNGGSIQLFHLDLALIPI